MENGWWVSTRRAEDAQIHTSLLRQRQEPYFTGPVRSALIVWFLLTLALFGLVEAASLPREVALGGSAVLAVVIAVVGRMRSSE